MYIRKINHPKLFRISNSFKRGLGRQYEEISRWIITRDRHFAKGFMLKLREGPSYETGPEGGSWWNENGTLPLMEWCSSAQKGHGPEGSDYYSDYTFAVWDWRLLVPFAKGLFGLNRAEMQASRCFVKRILRSVLVPVRTVSPGLGIWWIASRNSRTVQRHKRWSMRVLRFPRFHVG